MTGLAANSKFGPNVKLEDNAEQLPSAYIDKEKLPEKPGAGAVVVALAGAAAAAVDVEPTVDAAAVEAAAPPVVNDAFDAAAAGGLGLEEQTALKERPEPSGSGWHWPLGNSLGSGEPWLH